jgi:hypothetical protein
MAKEISRRSLLKGGLAAACALAATNIPASASGANDKQQLATLIDIQKCYYFINFQDCLCKIQVKSDYSLLGV